MNGKPREPRGVGCTELQKLQERGEPPARANKDEKCSRWWNAPLTTLRNCPPAAGFSERFNRLASSRWYVRRDPNGWDNRRWVELRQPRVDL